MNAQELLHELTSAYSELDDSEIALRAEPVVQVMLNVSETVLAQREMVFQGQRFLVQVIMMKEIK
jgi:hypothetical protein